MDIVISGTSEKPIYQQIYEQISAQIIKGAIGKNVCLPSIRTVARELKISVITVNKAWEELERNGFIYTMAGKGCFVSPFVPGELDEKRNGLAADKLKKDLEYYKGLGLSLTEILDLIKQHYNQ